MLTTQPVHDNKIATINPAASLLLAAITRLCSNTKHNVTGHLSFFAEHEPVLPTAYHLYPAVFEIETFIVTLYFVLPHQFGLTEMAATTGC